MKIRSLLVLLILTSLMGYLSWGKNQHSFLAEVEWKILGLAFSDPKSIMHPLVIMPLIGQLIFLAAIFLKNPNRPLIYSGIAFIGALFGTMFFIGIIALNIYIFISTIPFLTTAALMIQTLNNRKKF